MKDPSPLLQRLTDLVARLRGPDGCPWDKDRELQDVRAYLLEEAHEVAAAIDSGDWEALCDELGDLLFQLVFIARLAEEEARFGLDEIVARIETKMIARHPHVFGDETLTDSAAVHQAWERRKLRDADAGRSLLAGVPRSMPALLAAYRMTQKAAGVGFDWHEPEAVLDKLEEEVEELHQAITASDRPGVSDAMREELGDLLFTVANLARHLEIDPEAALARANAKFADRFSRMQTALAAEGTSIAEATLEEMDSAWQRTKNHDTH